MKQTFYILGVLFLTCFSFYYTNEAAKFLRQKDPIYISIQEVAKDYEVSPVNAQSSETTIIPGLSGQTIDIEASYRKMKRLGYFDKSLLVFRDVLPEVSINTSYDKYIIKGNENVKAIAFLFTAQSSDYVEEVLQILKEKEVSATFFVDGKWVENHMELVETLAKNGNQIENYGYEGAYSDQEMIWVSNMLESITKQEPKYCYTTRERQELLELCKTYHMYTVKPTFQTGSYPYQTVKNHLQNGALYHLALNQTTVKELGAIIQYVKQKGYEIETLSQILSEDRTIEK